MATIIQIKRSTGAGAPTTTNLAEAELAYSQDKSNDGANAILYIESVNNDDSPIIHKVGGRYYTAAVDAATENSTNSTIVKRGANGSFSANVVSAETFVGAFEGTISGRAGSAVITDTANALTTARDITLAGDVTGTASFNGSQNITIQTTANLNSVALGTDTTGDYVQNVDAGTGIVASGGGGEGSDITITLANTAVTPTTYGGASQIPAITVDQQGRITGATNVAISSSFTLAADSGSNDTFSTGGTLTFAGGTGIATSVSNDQITITNQGVTSIAGTSNEIEVSASNASVTIGLPNDVTIGNNLSVGNDLTVTGNFVVNGTALIVNTATVTVEDPLVKFGNANPADSLDIGFYGQYESTGTKYAGLYRDASDSGVFKLFVDLTTDPTSNVVNEANFGLATLKTNITGGNVASLATAIAVADGGTGNTALTLNGVLVGQGTSSVTAKTGSSGEVLQVNGSGVPVFASIDGGTY
jgi:hypothetical protein